MRGLLKAALRRLPGRLGRESVSMNTPLSWADWAAVKSAENSLEVALTRAGISHSRWFEAQADQPRLHTTKAKALLPLAASSLTLASDVCLAEAQRALKHQFDLLGSGVFTPRCPDRSTHDGYEPIDWVLDPVKKLRFPQGFHFKEWDLMRDRPGSADVKFPWELARCQHFLTLAQAYCLTQEPEYAREILRQIRDFDELNSVGIGVNWTCTMDVGIRAANWAIALDLIKDCASLDADALAGAYGCLFEHGHFIRSNLENHYEITSNHYLSNIVGLHFIGAVFADLDTGQDWLQFSEASIPKEIDVQILSDGADFESALPYHRLVLELFLASYRLAQHLGRPYARVMGGRLADMTDYLAGTLRPDGRMPLLGDCDDGRLMIATRALSWERQDPRHIFYPAALTLGEDRWLAIATSDSLWEALWWGFDVSALTLQSMALPNHDTLYPEAGVAISRHSDQYLMVTNPIVGTVGFGNHKHNEQLSFEYHDRGRPLIVDTGSYVYTGNADGRNLFRSTAHHNTLQVDGVEQNEFNPEWLFRMFEKANPEHLSFASAGSKTTYSGLHRGFETQLEEGVCHTRTFVHDFAEANLSITDQLDGVGIHELVWNFHLDPSVQPKIHLDGSVELRRDGQAWILQCDGDIDKTTIEGSWVSPAYGVKQRTKAIRFIKGDIAVSSNSWLFRLSRNAR